MCEQTPDRKGDRTVTRPNSKLIRLCEVAAERGGELTTFVAVAKAIGLTAARVTQIFGGTQDRTGSIVKPETLGLLAAAFTQDGVRCEVAWLYLPFDTFAQRLTGASASPRAGDWERTEETILPDLAEFRLDPPRPANEPPDAWLVDATLLFGTARCDVEAPDDGAPRAVSIALRNARLAIGSDSYRPLPGTTLGERGDPPYRNFKRRAGGLEVTGPKDGDVLEGDPLGGEHLAAIAGTNTGKEPFTATVAADWRSFDVRDADAPVAVPDNKDAILNALIHKHAPKDRQGRAILASATMRRPSDNGVETP